MACPHGFDKPEHCTTCMYEGNITQPLKPAKPTIESAPFRASFDGQCGECNLPIQVGQRIVRMSHGGYVHMDCSA